MDQDEIIGSMMIKDQKLRDDQQLMRLVAADNRVAKSQLVKHLWRRVDSMARYMSPYRDEAEDLAQEVMLQIVKSAGGYQGEGCLEAWADVIAARTILKRLRHLHLWHGLWVSGDTTTQSHEAAVPEHTASQPDVEEAMQVRALHDRLRTLLTKLPSDCRMAIVLKHVYGYSIDEVAEAMKRSRDAIRYLLRKGRARLRQLALSDPRLADLLPGVGK